MGSVGFPQTNIQLYRELRRYGYSPADLALVRRAYDLALRYSTCAYRPSGKPNLDHLVGTAGILVSLQVPAEIVAAGLLHSIYAYGDFGHAQKGVSSAKRNLLQDEIGPEVEAYLVRYAMLEWNYQTVPTICDSLETLDATDRVVVLIRLADRLEDHLDLGVLYCPNAEDRVRGIESEAPLIVEMGRRLGYPRLAAAFETVSAQVTSARVPKELRNPSGQNRVYFVDPRSYGKRASQVIRGALKATIGRLTRLLRPR